MLLVITSVGGKAFLCDALYLEKSVSDHKMQLCVDGRTEIQMSQSPVIVNSGETRTVSSIRRSLVPFLVPFVEECLRNDKLNCQGGILAVTGMKTRWDPILCIHQCFISVFFFCLSPSLSPSFPPFSLSLSLSLSSNLDGSVEANCDRFTLAVPYCGTHIKCAY